MTDGVRLVMLGRQGAGKGTQAVRLAQHFVVPHISTGDMLRAAVAAGTEFGLKAKSVMDGGSLVSDEIMVGIVDERLNESDTTKRGYILDGFPRTEAQAQALEKITVDRPLDVVLNLEVPEDVVLERITKRRVCTTCGHIYSVDSPPKNGWICDVDGGEVVQRDDDTEDAVRKRLDLYKAETLPLVGFYTDRDLLVEIDGLGTPDEVFLRLLAAVASRNAGLDVLFARSAAVRTPEQVATMRRAGRVVAEMHEKIRAAIAPGVSTGALDRIGREVIASRGASSNFLGYSSPPFPGVICASPNSMVVHGIPSDEVVLREGDIVSIDCGAIVDGWHGDAAFTAPVGEVAAELLRLIEVTDASLHTAIAVMREGNRIGDIGHAVETTALAGGMSVVEGYTGHAIGQAMHEPPNVPNQGDPGTGQKLRVGNVLAVEPMLVLGDAETALLDDDWSVVTATGAPAAHAEHTIYVGPDGPEILTLP